MSTIEDPNKQLSYLQQCLSSDKKPLGLFLGAGCPMAICLNSDRNSPLIPDIAGLTKIVRQNLATDDSCAPLLELVDDHFKKDGRENATVEDILTHLRGLRAVAGNDAVRGLSANDLDRLDTKICQYIYQTVDRTLPTSETPYHRIASWADAVRREKAVEVFTTNYDLLMEQAFEDIRVPYFDGFAGVRKPFFDLRAMEEDQLPPRWARLWKIHGSINWYQVANKGVFRGNAKDDSEAKRVIHPSHLKYEESRRLPYLAMMDRLRTFLKQSTAALILCGYSFRDEHINEVIVQGLQSTQTAIAFALLRGDLSKYSAASALALKRSNFNILARDGAVIGGRIAKWPEKEVDAVSAESNKWVKWLPINPSDDHSKLLAELIVGDFAEFGEFLQELVGNRPSLNGGF